MSELQPRTVTRSAFSVPKMDCPSEENLIRLALQNVHGIDSLSFDLSRRTVVAIHGSPVGTVLQALQTLGLGASLIESAQASAASPPDPDSTGDANEARTLWLLLAINALMFAIELLTGLLAQSAGLIADSLDMFADAAVYGVSLYAVGRAAGMKLRAAHFAGWLQLTVAVGVLAEVARRFLLGSEPTSALMIGMGIVALIANIACLALISRSRDGGVHMKASYIFSANDVIANVGVILAGLLVAWSGSAIPDLIIGTIIGAVVLNGARRILQLK